MVASHSGLLSQVCVGASRAAPNTRAQSGPPTREPKEHPALDFFMSFPQDSQK